jgi:DNA-binding transcriptional regulator YdaS (Cro superfamily)
MTKLINPIYARVNRFFYAPLVFFGPAGYPLPMNGMDLIRAQPGLSSWLARRLGLTQPAISAWREVPAERVVEIERLTGIARYLLRPDLCQGPWVRIDPTRHLIKQAGGDYGRSKRVAAL